jgi:hypothetical protein
MQGHVQGRASCTGDPITGLLTLTFKAAWLWAQQPPAVLGTEPVREHRGGAVGCLVRLGVRAAAMPKAETARLCSGGAGWMLAPRPCIAPCLPSMLATETARVCFGGAPWMLAPRPCVASMLETETARVCFGGAPWMLAPRPCVASMLETETARVCAGGASWKPAAPIAPMLET